MLLVDAIQTIETVVGIWLGMSAIAFILLAFVESRRESADAAVELTASQGWPIDLRQPSFEIVSLDDPGPSSAYARQLDHLDIAKKRTKSGKASARLVKVS
jgi:hypothetical protein